MKVISSLRQYQYVNDECIFDEQFILKHFIVFTDEGNPVRYLDNLTSDILTRTLINTVNEQFIIDLYKAFLHHNIALTHFLGVFQNTSIVINNNELVERLISLYDIMTKFKLFDKSPVVNCQQLNDYIKVHSL